MDRSSLRTNLQAANFTKQQIADVMEVLDILPVIDVKWSLPTTFTLSNQDEDELAQLKVTLTRRSKVRFVNCNIGRCTTDNLIVSLITATEKRCLCTALPEIQGWELVVSCGRYKYRRTSCFASYHIPRSYHHKYQLPRARHTWYVS